MDHKAGLMDAVVRLTAKSGIENLSTRTIVAEADGVSTDVYIYTIFGSKDNLLLEAFLREDARYADAFEQNSSILWETGIAFENRLRGFWHGVWSWLTVSNPETCLFLKRFSCSSFYGGAARKKHMDVWESVSWKPSGSSSMTDTACIAETAGSLLLNTAFDAVRSMTGCSGPVSENGYRMMEGLLGHS